MFDPPPGIEDMLGDAEDAPTREHYKPLFVDDEIGEIRARKPMPNAIPVLAMAANSKTSALNRADHLTLFVRNHMAAADLEDVFVKMLRSELPEDSIERISRAIATWGTARPTRPSSRSA